MAVSSVGAKRKQDLTTGVIWKKLLLFALPLLGTSLVQQLYNTVDIFFLGNFAAERDAMPAVGASSMLVTLLVGFFTGMSVGTGVVVSNAIGARRRAHLSRTVHTAVLLAVVGGIGLGILGYFASPWLLTLMQTPSEMMHLATQYLQIYFLGVVALVVYNICSAVMRSAGDSKRPLFYLMIGSCSNVVLDAILIYWLQWSVAGSAVATIASQSIPALLCLMHLMRVKKPYKVRVKRLRLHRKELVQILKIGLPAGVSSMVLTLSNVVVQGFINSFGSNVIAAFTAYFKVELFMYLPIVSFGQAVTTFVGQNMGAKSYDRVRKGVAFTLGFGLVITVLFSAIMLLFQRSFFFILTPDPQIVASAMNIMTFNAIFYFLYVFLEVFSGAIRGAGNGFVPMLVMILNMCGVRILLLSVFVPLWHTQFAVSVCYPITWLTTSICFAVYYWFGLRKKYLLAPKLTHTHTPYTAANIES